MHFVCAVITKTNEHSELWKRLSPFDENLETQPRIEYTYAEAVAEVRSWKHVDTSNWSDDQCYQYMAEDYSPDLIDSNKNLYTRYNPNSKYDWFQIGGRWAGVLRASAGTWGECLLEKHPKEPGHYDVAKIRDIDFSIDKEAAKSSKRHWEIIVNNSPLTPEEEQDKSMAWLHNYNAKYYLDKYGDCDTYVKVTSHLCPYAFLKDDGTWVSQDDYSSITDFYDAFYKYIHQVDPDWYITIVDCHI